MYRVMCISVLPKPAKQTLIQRNLDSPPIASLPLQLQIHSIPTTPVASVAPVLPVAANTIPIATCIDADIHRYHRVTVCPC